MKRKIRLLLVDDHEVVRVGLASLFKQTDSIDVVANAGTVKDAIAESSKHQPDVVLMDLRLPDGTGVDACREIMSALPETRVLFLTSYSDDEAVMSTILAGASGYLLKEVGSKALISAIEMVHDGQSILDPKVTKSVMQQMSIFAGKAAATKASPASALAPQERRILALVVEGKTNKEIARALGLSDKTVKNYLSNAFQKLNVGRRSQAAALYERDPNR